MNQEEIAKAEEKVLDIERRLNELQEKRDGKKKPEKKPVEEPKSVDYDAIREEELYKQKLNQTFDVFGQLS